MSKPQADRCRLLQVHNMKALVYHPQMDGLVIALQPNTETDAEASGDQQGKRLGPISPLHALCC